MERSTSPETTITTDVIKKICVQLGYYRNPVCNEKLYLHRKGFEKIDDDAFTPYTDVKVLWLESNALSHIPCGKDSRRISVKPAEEDKEKSDKDEVNEAKIISKRGNSKSAYVDCFGDWKTAPSRQVQDGKGRNVDDALDAALDTATANNNNNNNNNNNDNVNEKQTNKEAEESSQKSFNESDIVKDVFQSLYPTLRQLYLHNNLLREIPDLSGFQRLDTVNISNNFVQSVRAHCEEFNAKAAEYEKTRQEKTKKLLANSKSMQNELRAKENEESKTLSEKLREAEEEEERQEQGGSPHESQSQAIWREEEHGENKDSFKARNSIESGSYSSSTSPPLTSTMPSTTTDAPLPITLTPTTTTPTTTINTTTNTINTTIHTTETISRQESLDVWRNRVIAYTQFCTHTPLTVSDDGKISDDVPDEHRNPCSSLRTLNLSGNRLRHAADLLALLSHHNLTVLDLSHNQLDDGEAVLLVLERLPRLRSLRLSGNPLVRTLPRYRKTVLARCVELMHLDDRPVFAAERRLVTAWAHGGEEAERVERMQMRREAETEHLRRLEEFRTMVRRSRYLTEGTGSGSGTVNPNLNGSNSQSNNNNNNQSNHDYHHYASYTGIHDDNNTSVRTQTDGVTTETREATSVSEELREHGRVFMSNEYNDDDEPTSSESSENDNGYGGNYNDDIHTMTQGGLRNNNELELPAQVRHSTARGNVQRRQQQQTHESDEEEIAVYIPLGADR